MVEPTKKRVRKKKTPAQAPAAPVAEATPAPPTKTQAEQVEEMVAALLAAHDAKQAAPVAAAPPAKGAPKQDNNSIVFLPNIEGKKRRGIVRQYIETPPDGKLIQYEGTWYHFVSKPNDTTLLPIAKPDMVGDVTPKELYCILEEPRTWGQSIFGAANTFWEKLHVIALFGLLGVLIIFIVILRGN